ncbi:MAG: MBL fold metallo-hydrolase [Rickettsiales bacterium]|nr:MBL fold metallo-hydrolase [Rickettsiales bacterium]
MKKVFFILMGFVMFFNTKSEAFKADVFKTKSGKDIKITFIKHGSLMIDYDGKIIQIDPVSDYADYKKFSKFSKADFIFITHEHSDHFDKKAIKDCRKDNTQIILNPSAKNMLDEGKEIKNGDKIVLYNGFEVEAVPAYNTTTGRTKFHPKGRDNGYIFTFDGFRIYVAGDTENIPEMKNFTNIDVAFLPVNQPYTMTVEQAVDAILMLRSPIFYPYHYSSTNVDKIVELLKNEKSIDVRIRSMQ